MKPFVEYLIKNLVDFPDEVFINEVTGDHTIILQINCNKSDVGKVIGKRGKAIDAIRVLVISIAARNGVRVNLEIVE